MIGIGVPLLVAVSNSENHAKRGAGGVDLTASQTEGRRLFAEKCATCHTLAGSAAVGRVGPNLDTLNGGNLKPAFVLDAIEKGRARGAGQMPAGLLSAKRPRTAKRRRRSYVRLARLDAPHETGWRTRPRRHADCEPLQRPGPPRAAADVCQAADSHDLHNPS